MALPPTVDSLEAMPEAVREHYTPAPEGSEHAGKFLLTLTPGEHGFSLEHGIGRLKNAYERTKNEYDAAKAKLAQFDGIDATKAREYEAELQKLREANPEERVRLGIEEGVKAARTKLMSDVEKAQKRESDWKSRYEQTLVSHAAAQVLAGVQMVNDAAAEDASAFIARQMAAVPDEAGNYAVRIVNPDGTPRMGAKEGSTAYMTPAELLAEVRSTRGYYFKPTAQAKGTDQPPGTSMPGAHPGSAMASIGGENALADALSRNPPPQRG